MNNDHLHVNKVAYNGLANVAAATGDGYMFHVIGIHNAGPSIGTISFPDDAGLDGFNISAGAHMSFPYPLMCGSFTPNTSGIAVFYHDTRR